MEEQVSGISVYSRPPASSDLRQKEASSTKPDSELLHLDSLQSVPTNSSVDMPRSEALKKVIKKISTIEMCQRELAAKFEKVKQNLLNQIQKKDESNALLEKQIMQLRAEVEEGKKDLQLISSYIHKKANRPDRKEGLLLKNSQRRLERSEKLVVGSKKSIQEGSREKKVEKSSSFRGAVFKKN